MTIQEIVAEKYLAYSVCVGDMDCICFAQSAGKARYLAWSGAKSAGYDVTWSQVRSSRRIDMDTWFKPSYAKRCLTHNHVVRGYK